MSTVSERFETNRPGLCKARTDDMAPMSEPAMPFRFEALPVELQMHIISLTSIVTDTPARDLCNIPHPRDYFTTMCCGCCEGRPRGPSHEYHTDNCPCWPEYRFPVTSCECLILAQPLLAVSRHVRELALEHIYRDALFEIGPNYEEDFLRWLDLLGSLSKQHLARIKHLRILVDFGEELTLLWGKSPDEAYWTKFLEALREVCTRPGAQVTVICLYDGPWSLLKEVVDLGRKVRNRLRIEFVDIVVRPQEWYRDRSMGRIVE